MTDMNTTTTSGFMFKTTGGTPLQDSHGNAYYWHYKPPYKNNPAVSTISIDLDIPFDFILDKEGTGEKLAKWMGVASKVETGDRGFDDLVYIDCEFSPFCETLTSATQMRTDIAQLLQTQVAYIKAEKGRLTVELNEPSPEPFQSIVDAVVPALYSIKKQMPLSSYADYQRPLLDRLKIANMLLIGLLILGVAGVFINVFRPAILVDVQTMIMLTLGYSVALIMVGFVIIALIFHSSPRGYDVVKQYLIFGLAGITLCTFAVLDGVNMLMDRSDTVVRVQQVANKYTTHDRHGTNYHVKIYDWRNNGNTYNLNTGANFYYSVEPNRDSIQLLTHPGYLHMEWIEKYSLIHN
jgi:hypothetical protein